MKLSKICIERPVFATVLSLLIIVLGIVGFVYLQTMYFPKIEQKLATVSISYSGASPSLMQNSVIIPIENSIYAIDGLQSMKSTASYGSASINLTFKPTADMTQAMGDINNLVSSAITNPPVPPNINSPSISQGGLQRPVLDVAITDKNLPASGIYNYVSLYLLPSFAEIPGMGGAWAYGANTYAMRIWLDPAKMAAFGVTVTDIQNILNSDNVNFSGGSIQGVNKNYSFSSNTNLSTPQEFKNIIISNNNGNVVRIGDVADVLLGGDSLTPTSMRTNGKTAISIKFRPRDSANPIQVAQKTKHLIKQIQKTLPHGMKLFITYDQSTFLQTSINDAYKALLEAIILVALVVFLFLGSFRASLIPIVTIPVCVIGAFGVMLICGFSINVISLLAIILAIGLVVDDAIVVLENIYRYIEHGMPPKEAAIKGSAEIGFSVIAMTLTLAAVYAPIGLITGFTATIFQEFAFTLAGSVLISGFVALTLSPMMCALILRSKHKRSWLEHILEKVFNNLDNAYRKILIIAIKLRYFIVLVLLGIGIIGYGFYLWLPKDFIPKEDIGYFNVSTTSPPNSTVSYNNYYMKILENKYLLKNPNILSSDSILYQGLSQALVTMQPWGEKRKITTQDFIDKLQPLANKIPGEQFIFTIPTAIDFGSGTNSSSDLQVYISTIKNYDTLLKTMDKVVAAVQKYPGVWNVNSNLKYDSMVYEVSFQRELASSLGVSLQDVKNTFSTLMNGQHITDVLGNSNSYQVLVQMNLKDLSTFSSLSEIYVKSSNGLMVPLNNLIKLTPQVMQSSLVRYNRMNSALLTANITPGYSISEVTNTINHIIKTNMAPGDTYNYDGLVKAYLESSGAMLWLFLLALIFIYLILAAQFESFVDPFIILLTVPFSIVGALITMKITGGSLNLFTNIGLITLVGLISKHGILITQFANDCLEKNNNIIDAVIEGAVTRLRPILMTTSAMVLGSIPLALATGPGSVANSMIGWVIVGGLLFGTLFSLFIVPVAYIFLSRFDHKKRNIMLKKKLI